MALLLLISILMKESTCIFNIGSIAYFYRNDSME